MPRCGKYTSDCLLERIHPNSHARYRTLILAGYETTATSFSWLLLELARNKSVQTRLRGEIHAKEREIKVRGDLGFTANDFDDMPYLNAVIKVIFVLASVV